ncbi:MAG: formate dehydrogenase accessory sulfurtransferase FdhD [Candidatus Xenobia bacterium]
MLDLTLVRVLPGSQQDTADCVALEEPLEIRLVHEGDKELPVSITMRTPGHDAELALGFLYAEALVEDATDVSRIHEAENRVTVVLERDVTVDARRLLRHFFASSACGICGRAAFPTLDRQRHKPDGEIQLARAVLQALPARMREAQTLFTRTAGTHAAALFRPDGSLQVLREDVGRHNAVDKAVGRALLDGAGECSDRILMVSGRASYEILQKAVMAGIRIVLAVGAPSSLAVQTATRFNLTLAGFVSERRCNVYSGAERLT